MRSKEVECLTMLDSKTNCFMDMIDFLSKEKVINRTIVAKLVNERPLELPYELHSVLANALKEELLLLVDYSWELLPNEKMCITIITKQSRKDFTWNC